MPVYKDIEEMVNSIIRKEAIRFQRDMEALEKEFFSTPLLDLYSCESHYDCVLDVPYIDPTSIYMKVEGSSIRLRCKDKMGSIYQTEIPVPEDADLDSIKVERIKWFLRIRIPRKSRKNVSI